MRTYSRTKVLAGSAIFAALAYLVSYLEIPIFPAAPFLKLDFSAVFTLLGSFMFGPVSCAHQVFDGRRRRNRQRLHDHRVHHHSRGGVPL